LLSASSRDAVALWSAALDTLAGRISPRARAALAGATAPLELTPNALRVAARAAHLHDWIGAGSVALLAQAVERLTDGAQSLALTAVPDDASLARDPRLDFSSFIVSPTNCGTRDRVRALAHGRTTSRAPIALHGPSGAGKSHLLRCATAALAERLSAPPLALSGEALVLQLVDALWEDQLDSFRTRLRGANALVIDGLEALVGREATQEELLHALDSVLERRGAVLIASTQPPDRAQGLCPLLSERLCAGEQLALEVPGWETRVAIVLDRFQAWRVQSTPEIASHLAAHLRSDLDRLDIVLTRVLAESGATSRLDDLDLVKQILDTGKHGPVRVPPEQVFQIVARHFGVRLRDLRSAGRAPAVTTPRQIAMYLLRRHCGLSYPEIGRHFRRHHTTALHSDRLIRRLLHADGGLRSTVVMLEKELRSASERSR
jgi:chromosomal replication initiator protein